MSQKISIKLGLKQILIICIATIIAIATLGLGLGLGLTGGFLPLGTTPAQGLDIGTYNTLFDIDGNINPQTAANILQGDRFNYFKFMPTLAGSISTSHTATPAQAIIGFSHMYWRVAFDDVANDRMVLFAANGYRVSPYHATSSVYQTSTLRDNLLNDFNALPAGIRGSSAILPFGPNYNSGYGFGIVPSSDRIWVPSREELRAGGTWGFGSSSASDNSQMYEYYNQRIGDSTTQIGNGGGFQTRSAMEPDSSGTWAGYDRVWQSSTSGSVIPSGYTPVRPAIYISKASLRAARGTTVAISSSLFNMQGQVNRDLADILGAQIMAGNSIIPFRLFPDVVTGTESSDYVLRLSRTLYRVVTKDIVNKKITLYAESAYRSSYFDSTTNRTPATNVYSGSLIQKTLTTDFARMQLDLPGIDNFILSYGSDSIVPSTDKIWIPSQAQVANSGAFGYSSDTHRQANRCFSNSIWLRSVSGSNVNVINFQGVLENLAPTSPFAVIRPAFYFALSAFVQETNISVAPTANSSPETSVRVTSGSSIANWGTLGTTSTTGWTTTMQSAALFQGVAAGLGGVRCEFSVNPTNQQNSTNTIEGVEIWYTGEAYTAVLFLGGWTDGVWNGDPNGFYWRGYRAVDGKRMVVEIERTTISTMTINVDTTSNAKATATISGSQNARISMRTNFTAGWGETTATGGTYADWTTSELTTPDLKRSDSTQAGRIRYEFDANGINTISTLSINSITVSLTGYSTLTLWNSTLYLRIISADSGRRLIVEIDRINTDQLVNLAVTTTDNAKATATISGSPNARISVRTNFTTGWGELTATGGTHENWTANTLTSADVSRNNSTQAGRIRYEFDAVGIDTITTLTINGTPVTLTSYSTLTLWNSTLYLRIISADSGRRLIVEMDRINTDQLLTLAVTTTRNVKHNFNFSNNSHISSRMKMDSEASVETTSLTHIFEELTWNGNMGGTAPTMFTLTSKATFAKITISRPSLSDIIITDFPSIRTITEAGLAGSIIHNTGATNTLTIILNNMQQYEYTWTIETVAQIQIQQILNPPAGATAIANPPILNLNSSSGANLADAALANPGNLFGKTFAGWYTHPDYTKGTLITTTTQLQQHITATGGAIVFLYARWA